MDVGVYEAKTHLPELLSRVAHGEQVTITRHGRAVARLVPVEPPPNRRQFGALRGKATVDQRFFEPLPDDELRAWE